MKKTAFFAIIGVPLIAVAALLVYTGQSSGKPNQLAATQPVPYQLVEIARGLTRPVYLTNAGDGSGRLFVVEQRGKILIIKDGTLLDKPFLDVSGLVSREALGSGYTERGLLGLAFHPDYKQNGQFFIDYTDRNGNTVVARYTVSASDPDQADSTSAQGILYVDQPYANHNGGQLAFGPDGYLYVAFGDGGSGGDPQGNGQNLGTLLGKILRLDINSVDGYSVPPTNPFVGNSAVRPEIWAWGFRNPWRFSFDRQTGDLYIGDVGQNSWEEVDFQPASSKGGENYGWNAYEGTHVYSGQQPASDVVMPIAEYGHSSGRCSVTGGYVYRGQQIAGLQGYYLYGDWCAGTIWATQRDSGGNWQTVVSLETGLQISSFGQDEAGELYVVDYGGAILRLEPASGS
jgi:glucose/arabinose dehydrogenase